VGCSKTEIHTVICDQFAKQKSGMSANEKKRDGSNLDNSQPISMSPTSMSTPPLPDSDHDNQSLNDSEGEISSRTNMIRIPPSQARNLSPTNSISTTVSEIGLEYGDSLMHVREPKLEEEEEELLDDEGDEVAEELVPKQCKPCKSTSRAKKATRSGMDPHVIWIQSTEI